MIKGIIYLNDGFEEIEAISTVDILRRGQINVDIVSCSNDLVVKGGHNIVIVADYLLEEQILKHDYDLYIVPGGGHYAKLLKDERVAKHLKSARKNVCFAAICAGPLIFDQINFFEKANYTGYPGLREHFQGPNWLNKSVVVDSNLITAQGPNDSCAFAFEILNFFLDNKLVDKLKDSFLYKN